MIMATKFESETVKMQKVEGLDIQASQNMVADDPSTLYSEDFHFNPDDYLVNILNRAVTNKQDIAVSLPSGEKLAIFPTRGDYFSQVDDMAAFCRSGVNSFEVKVLNPADIEHYMDGKEHGRNFDELLWQASYFASQGRLINGCEREDVVEVRYWPNLTRLPGPPSAIVITALLTRYPTSITLAGRILKVPMTEMYEYYSAAFSAGFIRIHNREMPAPVLKPHRDNTMLGQLLSRISRL